MAAAVEATVIQGEECIVDTNSCCSSDDITSTTILSQSVMTTTTTTTVDEVDPFIEEGEKWADAVDEATVRVVAKSEQCIIKTNSSRDDVVPPIILPSPSQPPPLGDNVTAVVGNMVTHGNRCIVNTSSMLPSSTGVDYLDSFMEEESIAANYFILTHTL